jgi:hypothetical protein
MHICDPNKHKKRLAAAIKLQQPIAAALSRDGRQIHQVVQQNCFKIELKMASFFG